MRNTISNADDIIDSRDIIERIEELQELITPYSVGSNMPGYMPDNEAAFFANADDARESLAADMERDADEAEDAIGDESAIYLLAQAAMLRECDEEGAEYGETIGDRHYWIAYDPSPTAGLGEDDAAELTALLALRGEAAGYAQDWRHGATLIRDSHFIEYAQELADELGATSGASWPLTCIDWEKAARDLKYDYTSVEFDGVTYWIR